jgi:hypothetical protein
MNIDEYKAMAEQESKQDQLAPTPATEAQPVESVVPDVIEIDGQQVSIEELKKGYLRQSDYTRKTQEVSEQRKQNQQALELFGKFKDSPELVNKFKEIDGSNFFDQYDSTQRQLEEANSRVREYELRLELQQLTSKYPDFNEVDVLNEANKRGLTDLEFVYKALKADRQTVNPQTLEEQLRAKILAELQTSNDTSTIVNSAGGSAPQPARQIKISDAELKAARAFGMTPQEYLANKNKR